MYVVKARLPSNVSFAVPTETPIQIISCHPETLGGAEEALASLRNTEDGYTALHGRMAARLVWIEADDGTRYALGGAYDMSDNEIGDM